MLTIVMIHMGVSFIFLVAVMHVSGAMLFVFHGGKIQVNIDTEEMTKGDVNRSSKFNYI